MEKSEIFKDFQKENFRQFIFKSVFNILKLLTCATYHGILSVCRDIYWWKFYDRKKLDHD